MFCSLLVAVALRIIVLRRDPWNCRRILGQVAQHQCELLSELLPSLYCALIHHSKDSAQNRFAIIWSLGWRGLPARLGETGLPSHPSGLRGYQCVWPDRDDDRAGLRIRVCPGDAFGRTSRSGVRSAEHAGVCVGRWSGACSCRGCGGALHRGGWAGAGLSAAVWVDGGAVCGRPAWGGGRPDVPHRGPGAVALRRRAGVFGPGGPAAEAARLPH